MITVLDYTTESLYLHYYNKKMYIDVFYLILINITNLYEI